MNMATPARLTIRSLGPVDFPTGLYVYSGSALGPGGVRARLGRHLRSDGKTHWHIDYLRPHVQIEGFCYALAQDHQLIAPDARLECQWSQTLANSTEAMVPVPRFGASDCPATCPAHLVAFPQGLDLSRFRQLLGRSSSVATTCGKIVPSC